MITENEVTVKLPRWALNDVYACFVVEIQLAKGLGNNTRASMLAEAAIAVANELLNVRFPPSNA